MCRAAFLPWPTATVTVRSERAISPPAKTPGLPVIMSDPTFTTPFSTTTPGAPRSSERCRRITISKPISTRPASADLLQDRENHRNLSACGARISQPIYDFCVEVFCARGVIMPRMARSRLAMFTPPERLIAGVRRIRYRLGRSLTEEHDLDRMFAVCWWPAPAVSKDRGLLWIGQSRAPSLARAGHEGA